MTTHKDFKRRVRARMQKTGESYTAARALLLTRRPPHLTPVPEATAPASTTVVRAPDYAGLAGMSDAALRARTGCAWERWVWALDRVEAHAWPHRTIARHVQETYRLPSWWSQTVTVGYERIKGLRAKGQRRDGGFEITKSRTFAVPVARLYRAFRDVRVRGRWLAGIVPVVRTATVNRRIRMAWPDGTSVEAMFFRRGKGRSQVQIEHGRFADAAAAQAAKTLWEQRLGVLEETLSC